MIVYLVTLVLSMPLWAQFFAMPVAHTAQYVETLPGAYAMTLETGEVKLASQCTRRGEEILKQCLVHEGLHRAGHGECVAYLAQYIFALETKQSPESIHFARTLYYVYGEPACILNDTEGWDIH